jgi:hypothetical protein
MKDKRNIKLSEEIKAIRRIEQRLENLNTVILNSCEFKIIKVPRRVINENKIKSIFYCKNAFPAVCGNPKRLRDFARTKNMR